LTTPRINAACRVVVKKRTATAMNAFMEILSKKFFQEGADED
jgi:hypothetical protein